MSWWTYVVGNVVVNTHSGNESEQSVKEFLESLPETSGSEGGCEYHVNILNGYNVSDYIDGKHSEYQTRYSISIVGHLRDTFADVVREELLNILSMEIYCRRGLQFNKESNATNYEFGIRKETSFECGGISNPYRHSIIAKVCKLSSAIDEEEIRTILENIKLTEYRISLHIENADIKDVIRKLRIIYPRGVCFEAMSYDTRNAITEPKYNLTYTEISIEDLLKELSKKYKGYEFHMDKDLWIIVHPKNSFLSFNVPKMECHNKTVTEILSPFYKSHGVAAYMGSKVAVKKGNKFIHPCDYKIGHLKTSECSFMELLTILSKTAEKKCSWNVHRNPKTGLIMLTFI